MMKKLMMLSVVVLAFVSGSVIAGTVFEDDFLGDTSGWEEVYSNVSWGFNADAPGTLWGNDYEIQAMTGYTILAGDLATLTIESPRAWEGYPYLNKLIAFDGTDYTTIADWSGDYAASPEVVFDGVDLTAYAGQELVVTIGAGANWGEITNVQLDVVPEPASMLLLGLGGLLLRRKK